MVLLGFILLVGFYSRIVNIQCPCNILFVLTVQGMRDLVVSGSIEVVSAVVEQIGKGDQTDKMTGSRKGQQLSRQTKEPLTDP